MNLSSIVQQIQVERQQNAMAASATSSPSSSAGSSSSASDGTITANDFLQLLVSELQNQDPTADTDPNEYVNQLVNVNSLQQLISINQEVGDLGPSSSTTAASSIVPGGSQASAAMGTISPAAATPAASTAGPTASAPPASRFPAPLAARTDLSAPAGLAEILDQHSAAANSAIPASWQHKISSAR